MAVSLILRLRQRRVFRTAGYYLLGAWGLLQVGDVIVEPAGLPPWSMTTLLYLLVLGFPLALFLGWRYDITEHGVVRTTSSGAAEPDPAALRLRVIDYLLIAALIAIVAVVAVRTLPFARDIAGDSATSPTEQAYRPGSIAVLPFDDLSSNRDHQYLGDGISDTVIHMLSRVDGIQVTARTSTASLRDEELQIGEIGERLGVAHVLEGSVQREKDTLRVIARLVRTSDDVEVWSAYYDQTVDSLFDIQDEIAQEVATALRVTVLGGEDEQLADSYKPDLAAFRQVVLGRKALDQETVAGAQEAYDYFERAIALDPDYALAYTLLSRAMRRRVSMAGLTEALTQRASDLTRKALDLDPLLPEANVDLARERTGGKDFEGAERAARRALAVQPSFAEAYAALQRIYSLQSRSDDALAMARKALELDPEDADYQRGLAGALWETERAEAAIAQMRRVIRANPDLPYNYPLIASYLAQMGRSGEAMYWIDRALQLDPANPDLQRQACLGLLQLWAVERATDCFARVLAKHPDDSEAVQYLAIVTDDVPRGLANTRALVRDRPNSWYRKMQLAEWLNRSGAHEEVIAVFRDGFPELFGDAPQITSINVWAARSLAAAYQGAGQVERAQTLIDAGLAYLDMTRKMQGSYFTVGTDDMSFLALDGAYAQAVERLREAIDRDWQFYSFGLLFPAQQGLPEDFSADPRFREQVERLRAIMAEELAWYDANRERDLLNPG